MAPKIRYKFGPGVREHVAVPEDQVFDVDLFALLERRDKEVLRLREAIDKMESQRAKGRERAAAKARMNPERLKRDIGILDDAIRFGRAILAGDRGALDALLTEFEWPKKKWETFKLANVPAAIARKHPITERQIRTILDETLKRP